MDKKKKSHKKEFDITSAFLANINHEIRTPLNAIVGFSDLLVDAENEGERKEYVQIIRENNDILLRLLSDIIDISQIDAGELYFEKDDVEISSVCKDIACVMSFRLPAGVELSVENDLPECHIVTDRKRLHQVITNLVANAIKFTLRGNIVIGYILKNKHIEFYVTDTGIGVEKEQQERIFERFVKLDAFSQGAGLGLSVCQVIVKQFGGDIGVESEPGKGSRFWFTHPYTTCL